MLMSCLSLNILFISTVYKSSVVLWNIRNQTPTVCRYAMWTVFFVVVLDPRGLIKAREQQQRLSQTHWEHTEALQSLTLGGRECCDLCPQRTGGGRRGLAQAETICSLLISLCPLFNQSLPASPPCPQRRPRPWR